MKYDFIEEENVLITNWFGKNWYCQLQGKYDCVWNTERLHDNEKISKLQKHDRWKRTFLNIILKYIINTSLIALNNLQPIINFLFLMNVITCRVGAFFLSKLFLYYGSLFWIVSRRLTTVHLVYSSGRSASYPLDILYII